MKKFFMFLAVAGVLTFTANIASAQDQPAADNAAATEQVETPTHRGTDGTCRPSPANVR